MSKLGKFLGKPEEIEVQGEKLTIHPLKVKDLKLFMGKEDATPEEQMVMSQEIIKKSLRNPRLDASDITDEEREKLEKEEVTDEEIDNMNTEAFMDLMEGINKVNGLTDEKQDKLARLKERFVQQAKR